MKIIIARDPMHVGRIAGGFLSAQILEKPDSLLGLATGSTPLKTYAYLVEEYRAGRLDFSQVKTVNLDEYMGLAPDHPQSYARFMAEHLFDHINIPPENTHLPDGRSEAAPEEYDALLDSLGPVDIQVLGLGHNGHIGFNEPDAVFTPRTHLVALTESTVQANARFFDSADRVPRQACTMGIADIFRAKKILLLVTGRDKEEILHKVLHGPIDPRVPGSVLRLHPNVILIADQAALQG